MRIETDKNSVLIEPDRVTKRFVHGRHRHQRFQREVNALGRLAGLEGFPVLLSIRHDEGLLVTSRTVGQPLHELEQVPDSVFLSLRERVRNMYQRGVARHSLSARDVIVRPDGSAALVDFERSRTSDTALSPLWWGARQVTDFQLLRLIGARAPHLLDRFEQRRLARMLRVRQVYRRFLDWRRGFARK